MPDVLRQNAPPVANDFLRSAGLSPDEIDLLRKLVGHTIAVFCRVRVWVQICRHLRTRMPGGRRIMADQSTTPILPNLAEAFAELVLAYNDWCPGHSERKIKIERSFFSMTSICGLVEQFTGQLPDHVFLKLRSYMDDITDADLIVELAVNCSYATAARCLRRMIARRKEEYRRCEVVRVEYFNHTPPLPAALVDRGRVSLLHSARPRQAGADVVYYENESGRRAHVLARVRPD